MALAVTTSLRVLQGGGRRERKAEVRSEETASKRRRKKKTTKMIIRSRRRRRRERRPIIKRRPKRPANFAAIMSGARTPSLPHSLPSRVQLPRRLCAAVHAKRPKYNDADRARDERGARLRLRLFFFFEDRICNLCAPHADFIIIMNFDGATVNNNQKGGIVVRRL